MILSPSLNKFVLARAAQIPHRIGTGAPGDFATLAARGLRDLEISPEWCDNTIYGDPVANRAWRAWHDHTHLTHGTPFGYDGERRTALIQMSHLDCPFDRALIYSDLMGIQEHLRAFGTFPRDQVACTVQHLRHGRIIREC